VRQIAIVASQNPRAAIDTTQFNTNKIPTPVATDLPPLNPNQTGRLWPIKASIPALITNIDKLAIFVVAKPK
jgi:hypothetical protein